MIESSDHWKSAFFNDSMIRSFNHSIRTMVNGVPNNLGLGKLSGGGVTPETSAAKSAGGSGFADTLKKSIDEVAKMQQDASDAVQNLTTGKSEDVTGVMTAMEKSDMAFKTLLAIRSKLMDAYDEIKNMPI
jgi:flagellar hook-basal body complex protein FliE